MRDHLLTLVLSLLVAPLFTLGAAPADGYGAAVVAACPAGTHWDAATGTCK